MGGNQSNVANIQQSFMNNITQIDQQNCISTILNKEDDNTIISINSTYRGNFSGVAQKLSSDATCLMVSNMGTSVSNILSATLAQSNNTSNDLFGGFQWNEDSNVFNINQSVTNNISQINEATCAANITASASGNYIYFKNTVVDGNFVGVDQKSSADANCSMNNAMKTTTYNQAQASGNQSNKTTGMFAALVAAFAGVIGIIVIGVVIMFSVGAIGFVGYEYSGKKPLPGQSSFNQMSQEQQELAAAEELGLSPDELSSLS